MKKVAFYTLGCKLNYSETSTISRLFEEKGYRKVDFTDSPDIFIINTCSVTENADKKCHKIVREARSISPEGYVAIIGDRKSTRLNSSHSQISYAVFCLKKKNK